MMDKKQNRSVGREHCAVVSAYLRELRLPSGCTEPYTCFVFSCTYLSFHLKEALDCFSWASLNCQYHPSCTLGLPLSNIGRT